MDTKLTLKLDSGVIGRAKKYAQRNQVSLSKLVERYFKSLTEGEKEIEYPPLVNELSGIISLENGADMKDEYTDYLIEKNK